MKPALVALAALLLLVQVPPAAADVPRHGEVPATFSVVAPMVGDAGSYERSVVRLADGDLATLEAPHVRESFSIESPRDHYDGEGSPHRVNTIRSWVGWRVTTGKSELQGEDIRYYVDATDGALVASQYSTAGEQFYTNYTYFPGLYQGPPLCGLENALQRGPVGLGGSVRLFASACRMADYVHRPVAGDPGFVAVRADPWGNGVAIGFQQKGTLLAVLAWFVADIPYPVRLLEQLDAGPSPRFAMLDLVGFERGDGAIAQPGDLPRLTPLPPVRMRPHGDSGPDESGVSHPYPWSKAWAAAKEDADVEAFLDEHPRAIVRTAVYNELSTNLTTPLGWDHTHTDRWWFVLDDGRAAQRFDHDRTVTREYAVLPLAGPVQTDSETRVTTEPNTWDIAKPIDVLAPALVPTVADTLAWWKALATPHFAAQSPNGWLYNRGCQGCTVPWAATGAGILRGETWDDGYRWEASYVSINGGGTLTLFVENIVQGQVGPPSGLLGRALPGIAAPLARILEEALADAKALAGEGTGLETAPLPADVALRAPDMPGASVPQLASDAAPVATQAVVASDPVPATVAVAVVGGLAVVAGAIGLAKLFAAGLFSRLRRDRALDHPVRRALLEAIEAEPGIHLTALLARTGKGAGAVRHHLAKLEEANLVVARKSGGYLCYVPAGKQVARLVQAGALKADGARRVLSELAAAPLGIRPLASRAGLAPSTVEHHLARLAQAGLVERMDGTFRVTATGKMAASG